MNPILYFSVRLRTSSKPADMNRIHSHTGNKIIPIGCGCPMAASNPAETSTKSGLKHLK